MLQIDQNPQVDENTRTPYTREATVLLSTDPCGVAEGRAWVQRMLSAWNLSGLCHAVVLVTSELVTNVLLHTDSPPQMRLILLPQGVRIEISDTSRFGPRKRSYANDSTTGRGMVLVESLTTRWGCDPVPDGKVVWCEFDVD